MKIAIGGVLYEANNASIVLIFDSSADLKAVAKQLSDIPDTPMPGPRFCGIQWPKNMAIEARRAVLNKLREQTKETEQG